MFLSPEFNINPIGHIRTPFKQKFGIPRQPALATQATGSIVFAKDIDVSQACQGLSAFSHLWVLFIFDEHCDKTPQMRVRPPRLGGTEKLGVFATRSSYRPNHIGLSAVSNLGITDNKLLVAGVDMLDNTPIIDIKPYIAYTDAIPSAECGFAQQIPDNLIAIEISQTLTTELSEFGISIELLRQVLSQDPRPAHKKNSGDMKIYKMQLYNVDISWRFNQHGAIEVIQLNAC